VYENLDRPTVVQHLTALSSLATLSLDYRRAHGDQSIGADTVDDAVAESVVRLCLKLTETELKGFLARLAEWRDIDTSEMAVVSTVGNSDSGGAGSWRVHSRGVSYFKLVSALSAKLRSIFVPSMGLIWQTAADSLAELSKAVATAVASTGSGSGLQLMASSSKKGKKRALELAASNSGSSSSSEMTDSSRGLAELVQKATGVLDSVKTCCIYDDGSFINEVKNGLTDLF
jgi:hypothetical protein